MLAYAPEVDLRTVADTPEQSDLPTPCGQPVGYSFDPVPSAIRFDRRLKPIDHLVLTILISFAIWRRDSCWTTMKIIAGRLPAMRPGRSGMAVACERTVQRSIDRLKGAGYIRHERVAKPDPDDPRNLTGWRFYFKFAPAPSPAVEPVREVTNGPREVTKGSPEVVTEALSEVATPGGEATCKSPDSIVTQDRGEVRESEPTFNVANANGSALAGTGEENRSTKVEGIMTRTDATTGDQGSPARISLASVWTPAELAAKLVARIRAGGINLKVEQDPERGEIIRSYRMTSSYGEISEADQDELRRLRTHVLAYLKGPVDPVSSTTDKPGCSTAGKPAPPVPNAVQADVRKLIGQLPGNPDPAIEATVCQAIADALGDHKAESLALFGGLAGDVRRGKLAVGCLQDAFEAGCSRKARNRGARFTQGLKSSIQESARIRDRQPRDHQ